jgi:aspartate kinase
MDGSKFGGSSMATLPLWDEAAGLIKEHEFRFCVPSAPGARFEKDTKVTDHLETGAQKRKSGEDGSADIEKAIERFEEIAQPLHLRHAMPDIAADIRQRYAAPSDEFFTGQLITAGEEHCARLFTLHLNQLGIKASYLNAKEAGLRLTPMIGSKGYLVGDVHPDAYANLAHYNTLDGVIIMDGFQGADEHGHLLAMDRGMGDVSGAVAARAFDAGTYWIFSDRDGLLAADPRIVDNPAQILEATFTESRELAAGGAEILHPGTFTPIYKQGKKIYLKNTKNPKALGTMIAQSRNHSSQSAVIGVAMRMPHLSIGIRKMGSNDEIGYGSALLHIFADCGVPYSYDPAGGDYISVILPAEQLPTRKREHLRTRLYNELGADHVTFIDEHLAIATLVGQGLPYVPYALSRATDALRERKINVETASLAHKSESMVLGIPAAQAHDAVRTLYNEFIKKQQ